MLLTVLADEETGEVIGVMGHPRNRPSRLKRIRRESASFLGKDRLR